MSRLAAHIALALGAAAAGCAVAPPSWGTDVAAARAAAGARLVLLRFDLPGRPMSAAMGGVFADPVLRPVLAGVVPVCVPAPAGAALYFEAFGSTPGLATCVLTPGGLVLAARKGFMRVDQVARFVSRAAAHRDAVEAAAERFAALAEGDPPAVRAAAGLALAQGYLDSGNPHAAHRYFTLVTYNPASGSVATACARLARLEAERGDVRQARAWLDHMRRKLPAGAAAPADVPLIEALAAIGERRMTLACGILARELQRADHPDTPAVVLHYGICCHELGRDAEARRAFERVLRDFPDTEYADRAREEVAHFGDHGHSPSHDQGADVDAHSPRPSENATHR